MVATNHTQSSRGWRLVAIVIIAVAACDTPPTSNPDGPAPEPDASTDLVTAPSCMSLPATCGPHANQSCCESPIVTGGVFWRGYDGAGYEDMSSPATLSTFRLDRYEVTVGRFRAFVAAGKGTQNNPPAAGAGARPNLANSGWDQAWNTNLAVDSAALVSAVKCSGSWQTWTDAPGANENRPMLCINWYEAMAFCAWDGGYLPTEAEWMYAAGGGNLQRAYPWSSPATNLSVDCAHANFGGSNPPATACVPSGTNNVGMTSPAGDGILGHADLVGNACEYLLDYYGGRPFVLPCNNCADLVPANERAVHGGAFNYDALAMRPARREGRGPSSRPDQVGIRCARTAIGP